LFYYLICHPEPVEGLSKGCRSTVEALSCWACRSTHLSQLHRLRQAQADTIL